MRPFAGAGPDPTAPSTTLALQHDGIALMRTDLVFTPFPYDSGTSVAGIAGGY